MELIGGGRGVFDIKVDGQLVFSKHQAGRHLNPGEAVALLRDA